MIVVAASLVWRTLEERSEMAILCRVLLLACLVVPVKSTPFEFLQALTECSSSDEMAMFVAAQNKLRQRVERVTKLMRAIRVLNLLTACLQFAAGVNSLVGIFRLNVTEFLIAIYAIVFALLLVCFECRLSVTDNILRPNFGFLYGHRGMATYLLFIGLMDLGMIGHVFGVFAGVIACINACIVVFVGACAPRVSTDYPDVIKSTSVPSYGTTSQQLHGPIAFALATGALKMGTSAPASVHAIV